MKLQWADLLDKFKDIPAVVACHGASLLQQKDKIDKLQEQKKILRFSVNNWFDFFYG